MQNCILDKKDIEILRVLIGDCRSSFRSIGLSVGLSTNATKTRINKLISSGVIRQFITTINVAAFGYSKICYLFIRESKIMEETISRMKLLGQLIIEVDGINRTSMFGIAIRQKDEEKIQMLTEALKPALIQNLFIGQTLSLKMKLRNIDFRIIKCLLANPRIEIREIAKQVSSSSKTVSNRLEYMKDENVIKFIVGTDPVRMKGYIRFGMFVRLSRKNEKTILQIQEILDNYFVIALPMIHHEDIFNYQIIANNIFEIDPALRKIELLDEVKGTEVFIPYRARTNQDWIMKEIDRIVNSTK